MKITVNKQELLTKLIAASKCTGENKIRPIISCVKISAGDSIELIATDLELSLITEIVGITENFGNACFNPNDVIEYVSTLDNGEIVLETENNILKVADAEFPIQDHNDFPQVKIIEQKKPIAIDIQDFIEKTINCMIVSANTRENINQYVVRIESDNDYINYVSTDSFRMMHYKTFAKGVENFAISIPHTAIKVIDDILKSCSGMLNMSIEQNKVMFEVEGYKIMSRLIEMDFPNWKSVMSNITVPNKYTVNKSEFIKTVKRMLIFARNNISAKNGITLEIKDKNINFKAMADKGKAKDKIECIKEGSDIKISLNGQFIIDYVSQLKNDTIEILMNTSNSPVVIRPCTNNDITKYLTMPLAINE